MSFRLEEKIFIQDVNMFEFKKWLFSNGATALFPQRQISSVYFDNNLKMYNDSIEGIVPRKKIRIRFYNESNFLNAKNYKKEIKLTYYNYREKIVEDFYLNDGNINICITDRNYGVCKPIISVSYMRNYFKLKKARITIDEDIQYRLVKNNNISAFKLKDDASVIEIKSQNVDDVDYLKKLVPQQRSRFSKYCRGIELLGLN